MARMGRPPLFESVEEFEERAEEYFRDNVGGKISWTGLCLAVGASSRESLETYKRGEHGKDFSDSVKTALMVVENYYEEKGEGAMGIFALKNFGWKDKTSVDVNANMDVKSKMIYTDPRDTKPGE